MSKAARCSLGNTSINAAAFDFLARLHFGLCSVETPVVIYRPKAGLGGVGFTLTHLILALQFASLHRRSLVVAEDQPWVWSAGVQFDVRRDRNATLADVYWPSSCEAVRSTASRTRAHVRIMGPGVAARLSSWSSGATGVFLDSLTVDPSSCHNFYCAWANRVPQPFAGQCTIWWHSRLAHFLLRPSRRLLRALRTYALIAGHCPPALCGAHMRTSELSADHDGTVAAEGGQSWLSSQLREQRSVDATEQATVTAVTLARRAPSRSASGRHTRRFSPPSDVTTRPTFRSSLRGSFLRCLLPLPNQSVGAAMVHLHLRGGDSCAPLERPKCVAPHDAWQFVSPLIAPPLRKRPPSDPNLRATPVVLLSTDKELPANAWAEQLGRVEVLGFTFPRAKYHSAVNVEERLVSEKLNRAEFLYESLLDLGLATLAHGHVGSFYSNFARMGLLLAHNAQFDYRTFDGYWCPYTACHAGRRDADYFCRKRRPLHISSIELDGKPIQAHPARQGWVSMLQILQNRTVALTETRMQNGSDGTQYVNDEIPTPQSYRACRHIFTRHLERAWTPKVY